MPVMSRSNWRTSRRTAGLSVSVGFGAASQAQRLRRVRRCGKVVEPRRDFGRGHEARIARPREISTVAYDGRIRGEADELIARRAAARAGAAWAADFSGTWRIDNLFNGASAIITCTLVQAGNALTGSCKPEIPGIAASELTGTVDGSSAKWGYDVVFNGNAARVDYVAELAADGTLKGSVLRNGSPSPITAVKQ